MAQFRAIIHGQRGAASRLGSKKSGIVAHVNGWNIGVTVDIQHIDGRDVIIVSRTGGSNARISPTCIARIIEGE